MKNSNHKIQLDCNKYDPESWVRDFENEYDLRLKMLFLEHGVESHSTMTNRSEIAGLQVCMQMLFPCVACEAATTAADPVRRTTQSATCVRIPSDLFLKRWNS